jgi:hypothetical protein
MLNLISILSTFLVAQIIMMSVLNFVFGRFQCLNIILVKGIAIKYLLFFSINTFILLYYTTFYLPH